MKRKYTKDKGYILIESFLALFVMGTILLLICPQVLFIQKQEKAREQRLEAYRFMYELSQKMQIEEKSSAMTYKKISQNVLFEGKIVDGHTIQVRYSEHTIQIRTKRQK